MGRAAGPAESPDRLSVGRGRGQRRLRAFLPTPGSAELCRAAAPRVRITRAAWSGNPAPKRPSHCLQPAGVPRAHPDSGTPEPRAPLKPRSACGSRAAQRALFQAPNKEGRAGGPRSTSRQPALPLPRPRTGSARRGAALGFREESAARCPWRPQSCPSKWRCARGRRGRAARETPRQPAPCACGRCPSSWSPACCSW